MTNKVLFILKRRDDYSVEKHSSHVGLSTGLYNSASFMNTMLQNSGVNSALEVAVDNNCIDRLVNKHKPTYVIIEALWVVPTKFAVLCKLHPNVKWIIRLHSELPFLAGEGMAMDWIGDYADFKNIIIGINAPRIMSEVKSFLQIKNAWTDKQINDKVIYLPNFYPQEYKPYSKIDKKSDVINIGCFGAIRPLKNHMVQAMGALKFADRIGKKLQFHVNAGRIEMQGGPAINNLKSTFVHLYDSGHRLINHEWTPREGFLELCSQMDIGLQVSFSETFNIVGADIISQGVPLVGSCEIPWKVQQFAADPTNSDDIADKLYHAYRWPKLNVWTNQNALTNYTNKTAKIWKKYFA
jgi:hypothetical protein